MPNGNDSGQAAAVDTHYEFFPSVRRGYRPSRQYDPSSPSLSGRGQFPVSLQVQGKTKDGDTWEDADEQPALEMRMYGPGDVAGIDERQVVRVEPEPDTTTFPPNYFPLVEFAAPDLPWLFSPERANPDQNGRVRPWCCLVVVERTLEEVTVEADGTRPLPSLTAPPGQLPPLGECWAWAHAQVTGRLSHQELTATFTGGSSQAVSRLLCPRNLEPNTRYLAAVVPTFEPGKRVGLGEAPFGDGGSNSTPTIAPAWTGDEESVTLPIYHQWEFTTSSRGDFESLARELTPRNLADHDVGVREVDMSDPGPATLAEGDGLTRKIGGALKSPGLDPDPYPETAGGSDGKKRLALRKLLNDPASAAGGSSSLPTLGPPIYGQWYVPGTSSSQTASGRPEPADVPTEGSSYFDSWLHDLNVDPRYRIAAGYGTEVIRDNQERLMEIAWERFGDLKRANADAGRSQLAEAAGDRLRNRFENLGDEVVGFAPRLRDHERIKRDLVAAGELEPDDLGGPIGSAGGGSDGLVSADGVDSGRRSGSVDGRFGQSISSAFANDGDGDGRAIRKLANQRGGGGTDLLSDGGGVLSAAASRSGLAQAESLASGSFRRLTRRGGKLDRGVADRPGQLFTDALADPVEHDSRTRLASRFAGGRGVAEADQHAAEASRTATTVPGVEGEPVSRDPNATWRLDDEGTVLSLATAVERLDAPLVAVPQALIAVESVRDHVDAAREDLRRLRGLLEGVQSAGDTAEQSARPLPGEAVAVLTEEPTLGQRCVAIRQNTFDALDRQVSKLIGADTAAVSEALTHDRLEELLGRSVSAHERLLASVTDAGDRIGSGSIDSEGLGEALAALSEASSSLDEIETVLDRIERHIAPGTAGAAGTREAVPGPQPETTMRTTGTAPPGPGVQESLTTVRTAMLEGADGLPGAVDAGGWTRKRAAMRLSSAVTARQYPLAKIMAAPEFDRPMYEPLAEIDQQYLLPGVEEIPKDTIGALETNRSFVESYMAGLNHEMGREMLWRRYPTDRRASYFRQFWDYVGEDRPDVTRLHTWRTNALGDNRPGADDDNRVVLVIRGDLLRAYPSTRVYAVKAVKEETGDGWDRVPLLEQLRAKAIDEREKNRRKTLTAYDKSTLAQDAWDPREPIFEGRLDPDITFMGFDLTTSKATGQQLPENPSKTDKQLGWFFVLEERVGETRFGLDVPSGDDATSDADYGNVPYGLETGKSNNRSVKKMPKEKYNKGYEAGWSGLSWGHLVDSKGDLDGKAHVDVSGDNPAGGDGQPWSITVPDNGETRWTESNAPKEVWTPADEATWGLNAAHVARITWQRPVRVCIHADDILPSLTGADASGTQQRYLFEMGGQP